MKFDIGTEVSFTFKESIDRFWLCCHEPYNDKFCFGIIHLLQVFTHLHVANVFSIILTASISQVVGQL